MSDAIISGSPQHHFVGRSAELERLALVLERIHKKVEKYHIYNIWALTGMGKTWLAYEFYQGLREQGVSLGAWLSFEPDTAPLARGPRAKGNVGFALEQCWQGFPLNGLGQEQRSIFHDDAYQGIQVAWETLLPHSPRETGHRPYVLIIDALNILDRRDVSESKARLWDDIQSQILMPLVDQRDVPVLVLCISQVPLHWSFWELREECSPWSLDVFSLDDTTELLRKSELESSASTIFAITQGHPASIDYIVTRYLSRVVLDTIIEPVLPPGSAALPSTLYDKVQEQISKLPAYEQGLLRIIGVLRRVEVATIRHLLRALNWGDTRTSQPIHAALTRYTQAGLLHSSPGYLPFSFSEPLRRVIETDLQQVEQLEYFVAICGLLSRWYLEGLHERPVTNRHYFTEWMYFSLLHLRLLSGFSQTPPHDEWLLQFKECWHLVGDEEVLKRLNDDLAIVGLLVQVGLQQTINQVLAQWNHIERLNYKQLLVRELADYLFNERFPRPLSPDDQAMLRLIAQSFQGRSFTVPQLHKEAAQAVEEQHLRLSAELSLPQIRAYVNLFNEIYAIIYHPQERAYVMDPWLQRFLYNAAM